MPLRMEQVSLSLFLGYMKCNNFCLDQFEYLIYCFSVLLWPVWTLAQEWLSVYVNVVTLGPNVRGLSTHIPFIFTALYPNPGFPLLNCARYYKMWPCKAQMQQLSPSSLSFLLRCAHGYYGNPMVQGGSCEPCNLGDSILNNCDSLNRGNYTIIQLLSFNQPGRRLV